MEYSRKIKGFSQAIKVISMIMSILLLVAFIALIATSIGMFFVPNNLFAVNMQVKADILVGGELLDIWPEVVTEAELSGANVTEDGMVLDFDSNGVSTTVENITVSPRIIAIYCLLASMNILLLSIAFRFISKYGKISAQTGKPLGEQALNALNLTAKAFLVWSIGSAILNAATEIITNYLISNQFSFSFDLSAEGLIYIVLFLLLTYLLKYAAQERINKEEVTFNYYTD